MKTYSIEINQAKKFQPADYSEIATVQAKSKAKALAAFIFYLKTGLNPTDAIVTCSGQYDWNCSFKVSL